MTNESVQTDPTWSGYQSLAVTVDDLGVAVVTIDHGPVNLMDATLYGDLRRLGPALATSPDVRAVVVLSANPEFFIAHFDVALIMQIPTDLDAPTTPTSFHAMTESFRTMGKPTIAVIEGRVGGGGAEFAMSFDMRFASSSARFNQPEVALGILPGGSGTQRLPRHIGRARAMEMILGCIDVDADTAERWGLVNRTLPRGDVRDYAMGLARRIAQFPSHAVAAAKASVLQADGPGPDLLESGFVHEAAAFQQTLSEPSTRSAMSAFLSQGGQTADGERRLGDLITELGETLP